MARSASSVPGARVSVGKRTILRVNRIVAHRPLASTT